MGRQSCSQTVVAQSGQGWDGEFWGTMGAKRWLLTAREFREGFLEEGMFEML